MEIVIPHKSHLTNTLPVGIKQKDAQDKVGKKKNETSLKLVITK